MSPELNVLSLMALILGGVLAARTRIAGLARAKWVIVAACLAGIVWLFPIDLLSYSHSKITRCVLAFVAALALFFSVRKRALLNQSRHRRTLLLALAPMAVMAYINFGTLHGARTHVQFHDVAHYYLASKYVAELDQSDLYVAMLRAQVENGRPIPRVARDLRTYRIRPAAELLSESDDIKEAFTPERWRDFRRDVDLFQKGLGDRFPGIFLDHGFNATPVWTLLGYPLAQLVPAGNPKALHALLFADVALLLATFAGIWWAFGLDVMLLSIIGYSVVFGAGWGWIGGGFLRHAWFAATFLGLSCLKKNRPANAGGLFALAALLRLFPLALLVPVLLRGLIVWRKTRRLPQRYVRLIGGFAAAAIVLVIATAVLPKGYYHWADFRKTMQVHAGSVSASRVGLLELTSYRGFTTEISWSERQAIVERRSFIARLQVVLVLLPLLSVTACLVPRYRDVEATALGLPLIYVSLALSGYYYLVLLVFILAKRHRPAQLAVLFLVQGVALALGQIETRPILPFVYQSALLLPLFSILYFRGPRRVSLGPPKAAP